MQIAPRLKHLSHTGEMGQRIASYDWKSTSLGDPDTWPQSLVTIIGMMVENKFAMYIVWGPEQIQFYNDRYIEILSHKHPRALGTTSKETWGEVWDTVGSLLDTVMEGNSVQYENMPLVVNLHGVPTERFYTFCYSPIRLEDGSVGGVLDTVTDTTSDVLNKRALEKSELKFRTYLENSPNAFLSTTKDWVINYANPAALSYMNEANGHVVGRVLWDLFPGLEGSAFGEAYKRAMYHGEKLPIEAFYPEHNKWYRVLTYPLPDGIAMSFRDISSEKKLEHDLSNAIKSRDEFLSIASHELKTPLTAMKLQAQIIQRDLDRNSPRVFEKEKMTRFYRQTINQVSRLNRLVDDMLDVARIQSGKLLFRKEPTDFSVLLNEVMERMDSFFNNSDSGVPIVDIEGDEFTGNWDSFRLEQVINNLFTNAIRYGMGNPITVKLISFPNKIIFSVIDKGIGIGGESQKLIFEQFERAEMVNSKIEGMGLGLYITRKIIEGHNGKISVTSTEGEGATFTVELPR